MILIQGGVASGKKTFLSSLGVDPQGGSVFLNAERLILEGKTPDEAAKMLKDYNAVTVTAVGNGVMAATGEQRAAISEIETMSLLLAKSADAVWYVTAGIGVKIK
jgi:adenosyl cobinamide kinase/adenosyl cobinamide phosphate guanylyltransferase